jgi:hypothetical protein
MELSWIDLTRVVFAGFKDIYKIALQPIVKLQMEQMLQEKESEG